jgi:hypothetical protein
LGVNIHEAQEKLTVFLSKAINNDPRSRVNTHKQFYFITVFRYY